jgi:hypothetical protein
VDLAMSRGLMKHDNPITFKNSLPTLQTTLTNRLMLFRERIAIYFENDMKYTNVLYGQTADFFNVEASDTYSYHCALKG